MAQPCARALALLIFLWPYSGTVAAATPAAPECRSSAAALPSVARLRTAMAQGRFTAYQPTSLQVIDGRVKDADVDNIRADLTQLRERFDGLITYDAIHGAQQIPAIAAALKFRSLIIGVWDPGDGAQLDFLLLNVHPVFQPWFRDAPDGAAAQFVVNVLAKLALHACGPMLVKETGVPTAPESAGFSEARQAGFYRELRRVLPPGRTQAFAYFAAYDAPWRAYDATGVPGTPAVHPEEAHWGLYDEARRPKAAARELPPLAR